MSHEVGAQNYSSYYESFHANQNRLNVSSQHQDALTSDLGFEEQLRSLQVRHFSNIIGSKAFFIKPWQSQSGEASNVDRKDLRNAASALASFASKRACSTYS